MVQLYGWNPKRNWAFADEDAMGRFSNIAGMTHAMTLSKRSLERFCIQLFAWLADDVFE